MATKEHPILFSTPMVQAIGAGLKTQTRRIIKPQPPGWRWSLYSWDERCVDIRFGGDKHPYYVICPYGKAGDRLWVRETWGNNGLGYYRYKADFGEYGEGINWKTTGFNKPHDKWKPSIHMPRKACRIVLEITKIGAQPLWRIDKKDSIAEGILPEPTGDDLYMNYQLEPESPGSYRWIEAVPSYRSLWESINGAGSWQANPWVWVIEFKRIEKSSS